MALPPKTVCVEKDPARVKIGKEKAPHCYWQNSDVMAPYKYTQHLKKHWDVVVANPEWSLAVPVLFFSCFLLREKGKMWVILPSNYFVNSRKRAKWFEDAPLRIILEIKLGCLAYREGRDGKRKWPDSIFELERVSNKDPALLQEYSTVILDEDRFYRQRLLPGET